jgi:hypothetical protein
MSLQSAFSIFRKCQDVNTEAEETTVSEAVARRQPVKIQQTEKT